MLFAFLNFMYAHWVARRVWESTVKVAQGATFRISDRNLLSRSLIEFFFLRLLLPSLLLRHTFEIYRFVHAKNYGTYVSCEYCAGGWKKKPGRYKIRLAINTRRFFARRRRRDFLLLAERPQKSITHKLIISYWCFRVCWRMISEDWKRLESVNVGDAKASLLIEKLRTALAINRTWRSRLQQC